MEYAVVKTGGKQYKVTQGSVIDVDRLSNAPQSDILIDKVLLYVTDGTVSVGAPYIDSVKVRAKILEHIKGDKLRVAKFKAKSRYRKVTGFRHHLTRIQIEKIERSGSKPSKKNSAPKKTVEPTSTRRKLKKAMIS